MRIIISFLLTLISVNSFSQTTNFSFTTIPRTTEFVAPARGAEIWHDEQSGNIINNITETVYSRPLDLYVRSFLTWDKLELDSNNYDFTVLDNYFKDAIPKKQKVSICIITQWPDRDLSGVNYDGYSSSYPQYLHNLMQSAPANQRDYPRGTTWIPNYNSTHYLRRYEALMLAIANWINTTSFQGVQYRHVLGYVDMGGYGSWGEWNQVGVHDHYDSYPTGRQPLYQSLNRIIDAHIDAFPDHQILMNSLTLDGRTYQNVWVPIETGYHALIASNNYGKLGWSKKSWGWPTSWFTSQILDESPHSYGGIDFDTAAGNRWRYAPVHGEGPQGGTAVSDDDNGLYNDVFMGLLPNQVRRYHISAVGNGNFGGEQYQSLRGRDSMRTAWRLMGYRLELTGGNVTTTFTPGGNITINLNWLNAGVAPPYERWVTTYELQNQTTNAVAWSGTSGFQLYLFLPAGSATTATDNFTLPAGLPAGTYRLVVKVKDPNNYRDPLQLAMQGRRTDGSYQLRSGIVVTTGGNVLPVANAGVNQTITSPTSTVTLSGTGTDNDGTISTYAWTKISGTGGTITSPSSASTTVTGLSVGSYVFRLTVTDNSGGSNSDDMDVTVNAAPPVNILPIANAGVNQAITLPTSTTTLVGSGTDADGTIVSYAWTKTVGPTGGTITSASSATTGITALQAGTYVFRLTVTDDDGGFNSDDIQVVVSAALNAAPTANAGTDKTITEPATTTTLTGSGTDTDGTISSYAWTKVSGTGSSITSASSATTGITGLTPGNYVFRLTVTDDDGATAIDDVNVTVNPYPNTPPTSNAGADREITLPTSTAPLIGTGADEDGTISGYLWTKISGPSGGAIVDFRAASTSVTGLTQGVYVYRLRVTDDDGATATDNVSITVNAAPVIPDGNWMFGNPSYVQGDDNEGVTLGVKFRSTEAGAILRMRFWKTPTDLGPHPAAIWDINGNLLASGQFENETATGWQYLTFSDTVFIDANTTYVAGYYAYTGQYAKTPNYFLNSQTNGVLTAPASNLVGGNGVYIYQTGIAFPTLSYIETNYWVDVEYTNLPTPEIPNVGPNVLAGFDVTIKLPASSSTLSATGTDTDGTIASYAWTQLDGPVTAVISDSSIANPSVSGMTESGVYLFLVTVTDNDGATATDIMAIAVNGATTFWQRARTFMFNGRPIRFRRG